MTGRLIWLYELPTARQVKSTHALLVRIILFCDDSRRLSGSGHLDLVFVARQTSPKSQILQAELARFNRRRSNSGDNDHCAKKRDDRAGIFSTRRQRGRSYYNQTES
jgi:hypothetical protein